MIERMKKMTFLVPEKKRDRFLASLRKEGVVHISRISEIPLGTFDEVEHKIVRVKEAMEVLSAREDGALAKTGPSGKGEHELVHESVKIAEACRDKDLLDQEIADLENKLVWFEKWGEFDPEDVRKLKEKGIDIRLYFLSKKQLKSIPKDKYLIKIIRWIGKNAYVMTVKEDGGLPFGQEEIQIPLHGPAWVKQRLIERAEMSRKLGDFLEESVSLIGPLKELKGVLEKKREFLGVKFGMKEEEGFSCLRGYAPTKYSEKVVALAKENGIGYLVEDPENMEETPTYITNPPWLDVIRPVFDFMQVVPGYDEFDVSFAFLIFFSLFFAMIMGDAGYGVIFLAITFLVRRKAKNLPWQPFFLMYVLSVATIIWGTITGVWFGIEAISEIPFLHALIIDRINQLVPDNQSFIMYLCFVIGAAHLTVAHLFQVVKYINSPKCLAGLGWIAIVWGMFFTVGALVVNKPFPSFAGYFFIGGIPVVLVFANYQKNVLKGISETIGHLPLSVISSFSDIVSYLRIFAVGFAAICVAESFNDMALGGGVNSFGKGLLAAFVLFFGHALNIILGCLAVVVHGLRLNMLEFASHLDIHWSGKAYKPFTE